LAIYFAVLQPGKSEPLQEKFQATAMASDH